MENNALQTLLQNATMEELEGLYDVINTAKMNKDKERIVCERFGDIRLIYKNKSGKKVPFYRVVYYENGKRKEVCKRDRDDLIDLLYKSITKGNKKPLRRNATIREVFNRYRECREELVDSGALSSQTSDYDDSNWKRFFESSDFVDEPLVSTSTEYLEDQFRLICGDRKYTASAFSKAKSLMNGIYRQAIIEKLISVNYSELATLKYCKFIIEDDSEKADEEDYYSKEDVEKLRSYIRSLPNQGTYSLGILLHTYLATRIGETRALTWDDYSSGDLKVWHEIKQIRQNGKNRSDYDAPYTKSGKSDGRRILELPTEVQEIIEDLRKINGNQKYILNGCRNAKFSIPNNKFNECLKKYCEACGVIYHSSHKFRFYGITRMYEENIDEKIIQKTAGHASIDMTRQYNKSRSRRRVSCEVMSVI